MEGMLHGMMTVLLHNRQLMQRHKPARLDARHFKNTFISSRNQAQTAPSLPEDLLSTPLFPHSTPPNGHPSRTLREDTTAGKSSTDPKSASGQRLKLKDYMHLNGIEKRSRSKNNASLRSERTKTEETFASRDTTSRETISREAVTSRYTTGPERVKTSSIEASCHSNPNRKSAEEQNSVMIKQEILAKIQEERRRLADLETYLEGDFECKPDMSETFVFLFGVYNQMEEVHKINEQVGQRVIQYCRNQQQDTLDKQEGTMTKEGSMRTPRIQKKISYHWEEERKELDSPAKIIKKALRMTFDLTQLLNTTQ